MAASVVVLGFWPTESVVLMTFGGPRPFHARIDLPTVDPAEGPADPVDAVVEALVSPAVAHEVETVAVVVHSERALVSRRVASRLTRRFVQAGIGVAEVLRADGERWFSLGASAGRMARDGVPYDLREHPFVAASVLGGRVVLGSRDDLAASLAPDVEAGERLRAAVDEAADEVVDADDPRWRTWVLAEGAWTQALVEHHVERASVPVDTDLARLLAGMRCIRVRDAAWATIHRESAHHAIGFWTTLTRCAPDDVRAAPAALLAWAAWLAGDGALAWCALDRVGAVEPDYSLAGLVAEALTRAVPPSSCEGGFDWTAGLG